MDNIIETYITTVVSVFNNIKSAYELNIEIVRNIEDELNDLNHEIELSKPKNAMEGYKIYKEVRELRIKRRKAKDENAIMDELYKYLSQNTDFKNRIQQIQGTTRKLIDVQQKGTYTPRRRNDLTITNKRSLAYKPFEDMMEDFNKNKATMKNGKLQKA